MVEITLAETDRLDWALKQFRRRMIRSGMFKDMRRKRFYEKPSEARKATASGAGRAGTRTGNAPEPPRDTTSSRIVRSTKCKVQSNCGELL
ncbi:MAG: 30S ribosomal protein S21 [Gemmatimonadetes bacterium]|nr:30S ribosomal protein S21 [Gemmatimonadota bacterium]